MVKKIIVKDRGNI